MRLTPLWTKPNNKQSAPLLIELFIIHDMKTFTDIVHQTNPSQPPLNRGGASLSLPLLRGSRRGFDNVMIYGKINIYCIRRLQNTIQQFAAVPVQLPGVANQVVDAVAVCDEK